VNPESTSADESLHLRCGDLVEVRSAEEILSTLDANGDHEGLAFMPEMLRFAGQRIVVERSAHKTCDTITGKLLGLRMDRTVHLAGARCDGLAHGGCQARCLLFWKDAWLKRVEPKSPSPIWRLVSASRRAPRDAARNGERCTVERLSALTQKPSTGEAGGPVYRCQATELLAATTPLAWWEPMQYLRDWLSGNVPLGVLLRGLLLRGLYHLVHVWRGYKIKVRLYDAIAKLLGDTPWPYWPGRLTGPTPAETLDLEVGELVEIKPLEEILETLNGRNNRGIGFAPEMVKYCNQTRRVDSRVTQIIDEKTGKMLQMKNSCIILEDVVCGSDCSGNRLFCPRRIYAYWREIWLRRVDEPGHPSASAPE